MSTEIEIAEAFGSVPLLQRLRRHHWLRLAKRLTRRQYKLGDVIVRQGDTSMSFYVVLTGSIEFRVETVPGQSVSLGQAGTGSFFGELDLLEDQPRAATVIALEPSEMALLTKWDFENELRHDPELALALLPVLSRRIRELDSRLSDVMAAEKDKP